GTQVGFDRIVNTNCLSLRNSWPTRGVGPGFGGTGDPEDPTPIPCDGGTPNYLHNGLSVTDGMLFYAPMALGPGSPNTFYFGTDRLYRSTNRGDLMLEVTDGHAAFDPQSCTGNSLPCPVSTVAIWPGGDNVRVVGLVNGKVFATSTGSNTFINISPPLPANPTGSANKFIGRA